jgi:putative hemolysin
VLKLLRIDTNTARAVTEEEIAASLEEGVDAGLIEQHEHQMVQNVFQLDDRPLTSLMVPRTDVEWLDAENTIAQSLVKAGAGGRNGAHSWYPVCRGSLDEVVGLISIGRLLALGADAPGAIEDYVIAASFVPETLSGMELLEQFRAKDAWATQRDDGSWLLDGVMPVGELKFRLDIDELPDEDRGRYNTVAGLLMSVSGHLPATGECIACGDWLFEVVDLDGKRIDKVLASKLPGHAAG